jgi:hypothetical protein
MLTTPRRRYPVDIDLESPKSVACTWRGADRPPAHGFAAAPAGKAEIGVLGGFAPQNVARIETDIGGCTTFMYRQGETHVLCGSHLDRVIDRTEARAEMEVTP